MARILFIFSIIFFGTYVQAQSRHEQAFRKFLDQPEYKNAQGGIVLLDAETGYVFYEMNREKLLIPASVLKLITSATALEILGPDYRFKTRMGYTGKVENGILKGDLVVIGGGDPALGSEYFTNHYFVPHFLEDWSGMLKAAGIGRVEGRLLTDNSLYGSERIPPTWIWEDMGNYYGAASSALTVYDNLSRITFQSSPNAGMPTEILSVYPELKGFKWTNEVLSSDIPRDLAYVFGSPIDSRRVIRGTIPKNRRIFTIKASNPFPENTIADDFLSHLAAAGIFVTGSHTIEKVLPEEFQQVAVLESPPLAEIIKILNRESVNLFAEHFVKQIAAETTGFGDRKTGLKIISEFWKEKGLDTGQLIMEDGSGLSHFNAVSPYFISSVLSYMKNSSPYFESFFESLPTAGYGTLSAFNPHQYRDNEFRLKSGSMKRIRCYAGYIPASDDKNYIFIIMINHFSGTSQKFISELEKILREL